MMLADKVARLLYQREAALIPIQTGRGAQTWSTDVFRKHTTSGSTVERQVTWSPREGIKRKVGENTTQRSYQYEMYYAK